MHREIMKLMNYGQLFGNFGIIWARPDNGGGIGRQHIYPTDSDIVITMFSYSKTWQSGFLFNRMSENAHVCPGEILNNAFTPHFGQTPFFTQHPGG